MPLVTSQPFGLPELARERKIEIVRAAKHITTALQDWISSVEGQYDYNFDLMYPCDKRPASFRIEHFVVSNGLLLHCDFRNSWTDYYLSHRWGSSWMGRDWTNASPDGFVAQLDGLGEMAPWYDGWCRVWTVDSVLLKPDERIHLHAPSDDDLMPTWPGDADYDQLDPWAKASKAEWDELYAAV